MNSTLILVASNSRNSLNRDVAKKLSVKINGDLLELSEYDVPMYSEKLEEQGIPAKLKTLEQKLKSYAKLVLVTPEHNGYLPSFVKNIFDWLSRDQANDKGAYFNNKSLYIVSASPGATGGETVRALGTKLLTYSGAKITGSHGFKNYAVGNNIDADLQEIQADLSK